MARRNGGYQSTAQTINRLREIGEYVMNAAKKALEEGANQVKDTAKQNCPVRTGKLRDSIKATPQRGGATYKISADAFNDKGVNYGRIVEYSPHINRPFMYPALDSNRNQIYNNIRSAITEAVNRGH